MLQSAQLWDKRIHWDPSTEVETSLAWGEWHKTPSEGSSSKEMKTQMHITQEAAGKPGSTPW